MSRIDFTFNTDDAVNYLYFDGIQIPDASMPNAKNISSQTLFSCPNPRLLLQSSWETTTTRLDSFPRAPVINQTGN